jgi:hypothetical protein
MTIQPIYVRRLIQHAPTFGLMLLLATEAANAQTVTVDNAGVVRSEGLGRAFETFSVFGGTPGIAAAFYYSTFDINNYQLPISHTFAPINSDLLNGIAPYAELTLGYSTASATLPFDVSTEPTSGKLSVNTWSALAGFGPEVRLTDNVRVRAIGLAGYSHVGVKFSFSQTDAILQELTTLTRGVLDGASIGTALLGGALELQYESTFQDDIRLTANARYSELAAIVTGSSNSGLNQTGSFGVAVGGIVLNGPTAWSIAGRPVRWLSYAKGTWLTNTDRNILGFNAYAELGGGVQILSPGVLPAVQGGTLRASAILGPGVSGWLLSAALDF